MELVTPAMLPRGFDKQQIELFQVKVQARNLTPSTP